MWLKAKEKLTKKRESRQLIIVGPVDVNLSTED